MRKKSLGCGAFSGALLLFGAQVDAQEAALPSGASDAPLEEITVTARQRTERLLDVPVTVTALGSTDLKRYAADNLSSITEMAPQVSVAKQASGGGSSFIIRGIGSSTLDTGFDQSVALNIDGLQTSRGRSLQQSYFDLAQVEVLKGPQALFFGKNSPAGVISLTSANPTREFEAGATLGYEFEAEESSVSGFLSGPITDTIGARLAIQGKDSRGWLENVTSKGVAGAEPATGMDMLPSDRWGPKETEYLGRLTLLFEPSDTFSANLKLTSGVSKDNGEGTNGEIIACPLGYVTNGGTMVDPYADCKANRKVSATRVPKELLGGVVDARDGKSYSEYKPLITSLTMNWNPGSVDITSVTGYYRYKLDYYQNGFEKTIFALNFGSQREEYDSLSQELRALTKFDSKVNFMVGAFYQDATLDNDQSFRIAALPVDPATGFYQSITKGGAIDSKTYSVFGQLIWALADNIELAGGVRWTREEKDVTQGNTYVHPLLAAAFPLTTFANTFEDDNYSPEATLTWHPTGDTTLFAAYKTGYKSGGFGLPAILSNATTPEDFSFDSEKAEGFEIGAKGMFFDGKLRLSSAVYLYDYDDLQVTIFDGAKITYQTFNAGSARAKGIEFDARYQANQDLQLRLGVGYNKTRYRSFDSACYAGQTTSEGCNLLPVGGVFTRQDLSGNPTVRAPDWSINAGVSYDVPIGASLMLQLTGDVVSVSEYFISETEGPGTLQDSYVKLNAGIRLTNVDETWNVALIGRNLTDEYVVGGGSDRPNSGSGTGTAVGVHGDILGYMEEPRQILLQAGYKF